MNTEERGRSRRQKLERLEGELRERSEERSRRMLRSSQLQHPFSFFELLFASTLTVCLEEEEEEDEDAAVAAVVCALCAACVSLSK